MTNKNASALTVPFTLAAILSWGDNIACDYRLWGWGDRADISRREVAEAGARHAEYRQGKLEYLHRAKVLRDLLMPPGNRLEALRGDRAGQHSIRINDQWRICFVWSDGDAERVEIVDYH